MIKTNECTGECCECFTLTGKAVRRMNRSEDPIKSSMLHFLSKSEPYEGENQYHYTCHYWDHETRLCQVYENRPLMCSLYPYDQICGVCGMIGPDVKNVEEADTAWCCIPHYILTTGKKWNYEEARKWKKPACTMKAT